MKLMKLIKLIPLIQSMHRTIDTTASFKHHTPPMPLKHFTETFLVVVLGAAMALTGLLTATLSPLPEGALSWGVLFILSIIYPLSLYGLFQNRRADNFFRNLHWFPALILLGWLALQGVLLTDASWAEAAKFYTWSFTLGAVTIGFILIIVYCLKVIRRRIPRFIFLALILVPFTAVAVMSERNGAHFEREVASVLWQGDFWSMKGTGLFARLSNFRSQTGKNLDPSVDPAEEGWRERLRAQKRREERIAQHAKDGKTKSASSSSDRMMIASVSSRPTKLPSSGFGWSGIVLVLVACYSAALHRSTQKRMAN